MMKSFLFAAAVAVLTVSTSRAQAPTPAGGTRVPAFTASLLDAAVTPPKATPFDSQHPAGITAYVIVSTTCPATKAYAERLKELDRTYHAKGVQFVYIYPNRDDSLGAKLAFHREHEFTGPLIDDQGARIAVMFGAQRTTEVFVVNRDGLIVYHGAVDDSKDNPNAVKQRFVATALDETLAGKPVTTATSFVSACGIHF